MKRWRHLTLLLPLGLVLAGCGEWELTQNVDLNVALDPPVFNIVAKTVFSDQGEEISSTVEYEPINITLGARAGSLGGYVEGFVLEVFYSDGTPTVPGDNMRVFTDGVFFEAGIECVPPQGQQPPSVCTINYSNEVFFVPGEVVEYSSGTLPEASAAALVFNPRSNVGAYATITIFGRDELGRDFQYSLDKVAITTSVSNEVASGDNQGDGQQ